MNGGVNPTNLLSGTTYDSIPLAVEVLFCFLTWTTIYIRPRAYIDSSLEKFTTSYNTRIAMAICAIVQLSFPKSTLESCFRFRCVAAPHRFIERARWHINHEEGTT